MKAKVIIVTALMLCMSCAGIQPLPYETPQDKIVHAETVITAANNSVAEMLNAHLINVKDAKKYREKAKDAAKLISEYKALVSDGDESLSDLEKWRILEDILNEINNRYVLKLEGGK